MSPAQGSLRLATRGSPLALYQAELVASLVARSSGGRVAVELVVVETKGDRSGSLPLHAIGGEGVFVKEVEAAVLENRADAAVHSAKDLPASGPAGADLLSILAVPERADPRDCLVGGRLDHLAAGSLVATGSVRRRAQLAWLRPDLVFTELRGNIGSRLGKVPPGGAVVMARAALDRLGESARASETLSVTRMLPQVGQGAIAVSGRPGDESTAALLAPIEHRPSRLALEAERAYLAGVGGGCQLPVGALATPGGDGRLALEAMIAGLDGHSLVRRSLVGDDPVTLGAELARLLLVESGGAALLSQVAAARP